jgi:hypothetical protein
MSAYHRHFAGVIFDLRDSECGRRLLLCADDRSECLKGEHEPETNMASSHSAPRALMGKPIPRVMGTVSDQGIRSGNLGTKPSRFGIFTFGKVCAFITSLAPMILFCARMNAVNA